jgi:hypothetical protein
MFGQNEAEPWLKDHDGQTLDVQEMFLTIQGEGPLAGRPAVFVRLEDLPNSPDEDAGARVTNAGIAYTIHEVKPDGLGGAHLLLHRI